MNERPIVIATRGSALALAQANMILAQCRAAFPRLAFELRIIKTTGDKLQTASVAQESKSLPKGLFTKELEVALLKGKADLAVHSLKDLPTELPAGLKLGAVGKRADVRDVLIYRSAAWLKKHQPEAAKRGFKAGTRIKDLPAGAVVATSSTRRKALLRRANAALQTPDIRGNVATRMQKLMDQPGLDATILALAGITRLKFKVKANGTLLGEGVPEGLLATVIDTDEMLPCVGQGAIGIEIREGDERLEKICARLNDADTMACVTAERAFLAGMGGGCQSPVAAHAEVVAGRLQVRALSFASGPVRGAKAKGATKDAAELGLGVARELK